jgi:hypothetical protein
MRIIVFAVNACAGRDAVDSFLIALAIKLNAS